MLAILASGLNHYKIITRLNSDKLASACALSRHTMVDCFHDVKKLGESNKQMKGYKEGLVLSEVATINHTIYKKTQTFRTLL